MTRSAIETDYLLTEEMSLLISNSKPIEGGDLSRRRFLSEIRFELGLVEAEIERGCFEDRAGSRLLIARCTGLLIDLDQLHYRKPRPIEP